MCCNLPPGIIYSFQHPAAPQLWLYCVVWDNPLIRALVSVHDVMPETLNEVKRTLNTLKGIPTEKITLLVVPGRDWQRDQIDQIKLWQQQGYRLAGHGWLHACSGKKTALHQLHSFFISRNVAEHLSKSQREVEQLICDCHQWFKENRVPVSSLYVPPAWALGSWSTQSWHRIPFKQIETLHSVLDAQQGKKPSLLQGFEADTALRWLFLRGYNWLNRKLAQLQARPLRIAIHPFDTEYRLKKDIQTLAAKPYQWINYDELGHKGWY